MYEDENSDIFGMVDKVVEVLKDVTFPWIFVAENVDMHGIKILASSTNLKPGDAQLGNTEIEEIYRRLLEKDF